MAQYKTNALGIGGFASAFYLGYLLFQIPSGYLLDNFSLKKVLATSILACTVAFILFIYAHHYWLGYALRFFIGISSALSFISVLYIARTSILRPHFNFIAGLTIAFGTLSAAGAQLFTAALSNYFKWQTIITFLSLWGFFVAFFIILMPIKKSSNENTGEFSKLGKKILTLLKTKAFIINGVIGSLLYLPTSLLATAWGISFAHKHYQLSNAQGSTLIFLLFLGWAIGSPAIGIFLDKSKNTKLFMMSCSLLATIFIMLFLYLPAKSANISYLLIFLFGLFSSIQVGVWKIFNRICPKKLNGLGISLTNMIIMLGGTIFHLVLGALLTEHGTVNSIDFQKGIWLLPVILLVACLLIQLIQIDRTPSL